MNKIVELCGRTGIKNPEITKLKGDLSERSIYRIRHGNGTLIGVTGSNTAENGAFLSFRDTFEKNSFNVPGLISVSGDMTAYLLEDLGDMTVRKFCEERSAQGDTGSIRSVYSEIMKTLPCMQSVLYDKIDYSKCYQGAVFGREAMEKDAERFKQYYLGGYLSCYDKVKWNRFIGSLIKKTSECPANRFMYRDFQTRNMMIRSGEIYFIDFQSGRKGPGYYDAASFIYSSGTIEYEGMENELAEIFFDRSEYPHNDREENKTILRAFGCLRLIQAAGNYSYYYYKREDPSFSEKIEMSVKLLQKLANFLGYDTGLSDPG